MLALQVVVIIMYSVHFQNHWVVELQPTITKSLKWNSLNASNEISWKWSSHRMRYNCYNLIVLYFTIDCNYFEIFSGVLHFREEVWNCGCESIRYLEFRDLPVSGFTLQSYQFQEKRLSKPKKTGQKCYST